jgi:hypothetical protein
MSACKKKGASNNNDLDKDRTHKCSPSASMTMKTAKTTRGRRVLYTYIKDCKFKKIK